MHEISCSHSMYAMTVGEKVRMVAREKVVVEEKAKRKGMMVGDRMVGLFVCFSYHGWGQRGMILGFDPATHDFQTQLAVLGSYSGRFPYHVWRFDFLSWLDSEGLIGQWRHDWL